jgi:hypothetical protein
MKVKRQKFGFDILPIEIISHILGWYPETSKEFFDALSLSKEIKKNLMKDENLLENVFFKIKLNGDLKWEIFHYITRNITFVKCLHVVVCVGLYGMKPTNSVNSIIASNTQLKKLIFECDIMSFDISQKAMDFMSNLKLVDYISGFNASTLPRNVEIIYVRSLNRFYDLENYPNLKEIYCTSNVDPKISFPEKTKLFIPKNPKNRTYCMENVTHLTLGDYWEEITKNKI